MISFVNNAIGGPIEHALASFARLTIGFPSLIVQSTQGVWTETHQLLCCLVAFPEQATLNYKHVIDNLCCTTIPDNPWDCLDHFVSWFLWGKICYILYFNHDLFLISIWLSGLNLNLSNKEYTHGIVIRFRSRELSFTFIIWLYGTSICWLLCTGIFCSWGLWVIYGKFRIPRCKDPNVVIIYCSVFVV